MPPAVSINLCCYNSEAFLEETLRSIFAQTYHDWELVIVNDGSTDSTEKIIRKHLEEGRPIVYHPQPNAGLGHARNRALEISRGEFVAFIDHDDVWHAEKLQRQMAVFAARPEVGLVYADAAMIDAKGGVLREGEPGHRARDGGVFADLLIQGNFINWQTVVVRRGILQAIGGFRPYGIVEDYDVLLRCAVDHPFVGLEQVLALYRMHESNASRDLERRWRELVHLEEYWLENLPPAHQHLRPALQRKIADLYYDWGGYLCERGDLRAGRQHLRRAWPAAAHRWRALGSIAASRVLGQALFPRLIRWKRSLGRRRSPAVSA